MSDKTTLYESVQVNLGKNRYEIWGNYALGFLNSIYESDRAIYGDDTLDLYEALFEEHDSFALYEEKGMGLGSEAMKAGNLTARAAAKGISKPMGLGSEAMKAGGLIKPNQVDGLGAKLKTLFASLGSGVKGYFSKGIAGVLANPLPLIAAGAGAGAVVALIKKFKKLSDDKKKAALAALSKADREKAIATLSKSDSEIKKELEEKKETKKD